MSKVAVVLASYKSFPFGFFLGSLERLSQIEAKNCNFFSQNKLKLKI